jgi:hypothetical protein
VKGSSWIWAALLANACGGGSNDGAAGGYGRFWDECERAVDAVGDCVATRRLRVPFRLPVPVGDTCEDPDRCYALCINRSTCEGLDGLAWQSAPDLELDLAEAARVGACFADCQPCVTLFDAYRTATSKPCLSR